MTSAQTTRDCKVGIQLQPAGAAVSELRDAWCAADELGADSIWVWDHFFPIMPARDDRHFEGWTLLAAMAADTSQAMLGTLVTGNSYRNPDLLADMARTVDHIAEGRLYLGVGSGWFEPDYDAYGYEFGTAGSRLRDLEAALPRIKARLAALDPPPMGRLPLLIGGSGEKVTLRLVAEYADAWNTFFPPENFIHKSRVLDEWCRKLGRDPTQIERTVLIRDVDVADFHRFVAAGAHHIIVMAAAPYDLSPLQQLLDLRG